jgi:hypothetical protein
MIILINKFKLITATCKGAKRKKKVMMMTMMIIKRKEINRKEKSTKHRNTFGTR